MPTGTNLLGLVKHTAGTEAGYLGATFGRPFPDLPRWATDEAEDNADMWATPEESRADLVALYRRVWAHSDATVAALPLDAVGLVPWWPAERREPTLHRVLAHVVAETSRHAGQADIVRELVDGPPACGRASATCPTTTRAGGPPTTTGSSAPRVRPGAADARRDHAAAGADWAVDRERWRAVEAYGYDHAWTFDHLAWRSLADSPWFATVPTLTAAALSTTTLRLGTWVATPNFRHPVPFAKELMTLDHLSGGRLNVGLGAGTDGYDATMLGQPALSPGRRHARFVEFVEVLGRVLSHARTSWSGDWYTADERPDGPRLRPAAAPAVRRRRERSEGHAAGAGAGDGWVTTTGAPPDADAEDWWAAAADRAARFAGGRARSGPRPGTALPEGFARYLNLEARTADFGSAEQVVDALGPCGRARLHRRGARLAPARRRHGRRPGPVEALAARLPEVHAL